MKIASKRVFFVVIICLGAIAITPYLLDLYGQYLTTKMFEAIERRDDSRVKFLIKSGADIHALSSNGLTAISYVMYYRLDSSFELLQLMEEKGLDLNARGKKGTSALHTASANNLRILRYLHENGGDLNIQRNNGDTLMHTATSAASTATAEYLLANKMAFDRKNNRGATPLYHAVYRHRLAHVALLIDAGADLQTTLPGGHNLLHAVVRNHLNRNHSQAIVNLLIKNGVNIDHQDKQGETPLHLAAKLDDAKAAAALIANGARLELKDSQGKTPLMYAAAHGGKSLSQLFRGVGEKDVEQLIREAIAREGRKK